MTAGPRPAATDFGPDRPFTQTEFTRDDDFRNQGNAPYRQLPDLIETSLPEFWERAFREIFGTTFDRPAIQPFAGTAPDCARRGPGPRLLPRQRRGGLRRDRPRPPRLRHWATSP